MTYRILSPITIQVFRLLLIAGLLAMTVPLAAPSAHAAGPWYVAPDGSDSNSCLSAGSPCATINGAIGKASSGDTIYVATGTYTSSAGSEVVLIYKDITLSGGWDVTFTSQNANSIIDGQSARQGMMVDAGVSATVTHVIIQNGKAVGINGGGLFNSGMLTLDQVSIINNITTWDGVSGGGVGGGLHNQGTLVATHSTISYNTAVDGGGGGLSNSGNLTLLDSSVSNNTVTITYSGPGGGGLYNASGTLTVINSAVVGNIVNSHIPNNLIAGGGILSRYGTFALNNSTVSGNSLVAPNIVGNLRGGGLYSDSGDANIASSTIAYNTVGDGNDIGSSGGIYKEISGGNLTLKNSVVAKNKFASTSQDCGGDYVTSAGYNLIGNISGCTFTASTGDLLNQEPQLVYFGNYYALLSDSPAIDSGNPSGCTDHLGNPLLTDQRGAPRALDGDGNSSANCDIGAYEFDPDNPLRQVFLPLIRRPKARPGLNGTVTENGAPAIGVSLDVRFYNGSSFSTIATTATDADGDYFFTNLPSLSPGQSYYVRYQNTSGGNPNRLWTWHTRSINAYTAGSAVSIGNFDLANIALVSPADGATVSVPHTFQWTPRPASPTDSYEFNLYDPYNFNPYFFTDPPLGYVGSYTLNSLPPGFGVGPLYVWELWVYSPDGGFGISYETRVVYFSNTGFARPESLDALNPVERPGDVYRRLDVIAPDGWRQPRD